MRAVIVLTLVLAGAASNPGDVWPAFRGNGHSITVARNLPLKWSATQNIAWQVDLPGHGQSSPVIWKDRVFVTAIAGEMQDTLIVRCVDLATGKELWEEKLHASQGTKSTNYVSKAAPTPAVDAERLYVFFESSDLLAYSHAGDLLWARSLARDYGRIRSTHGLGSSPVLTKDALIVTVLHDGGSYVLAVDKKTGKEIWRRGRPYGACWTTPTVITEGKRELLLISASGMVEALDAKTGEPVWSVEGIEGNNVPSPSVGEGLVMIAGSKRGSTLAIRLGGEGDVTKSHVAWRQDRVTSTFGSPLVHRGLAYVVSDVGVVEVLDLKTGESRNSTRLSASCWASPFAAGDRLYFFSTDGGTTVIKAGTALEKLAENSFPVEGRVNGVAAVNGAIVFRTDKKLVRIGK